jgi:hypothetical protein
LKRGEIGQAFHARALRDHTYAQRAAQADFAFRECRARHDGAISPQTQSLATMQDWAQVQGWRDAAARIELAQDMSEVAR